MKTYLLKPGLRGMLVIDREDPTNLDSIDYMSSQIDWMYLIPEDGELIVKEKDNKETATLQVHKNNVAIVFYDQPYIKNRVIVIDNPQWAENIAARVEYLEKQAAENKCCGDCENCMKCADPNI